MNITNNETANSADSDDEISIVDLIATLIRHKRIVLGTPAVFGAIAVAYALLATPIFEAETSILPPQQQQSSASMILSQLGGLAGAAGGALGLKNPTDLYIAMLKSRGVAANLIEKFKLQEWYETKTATDTRKSLEQATNISSGKDGLIRVSVADRSPELAANIANAYVDQLKALSKNLAVTEAAQRRVFFEKQLNESKAALTKAELEMKQVQQSTGMLQLEAQGRVAIEAGANLRAQIASRQVQLAALSKFATDRNPDVQRLQAEISGIESEIRGISSSGNGEDALFSRKGISEAGLAYVRKMRELKYQETLFGLISQQYELAKIDEAKDGASIQILDKALVPEEKSKPRRGVIVLFGLVAGIFAGCVAAFSIEPMLALRGRLGNAKG